MILEAAILQVKKDKESDFEPSFQKAKKIISMIPFPLSGITKIRKGSGYVSRTLAKAGLMEMAKPRSDQE